MMPEVFELAARNAVPLRVSVTSETSDDVGHQYMMLVIPLGRVSIGAPHSYIYGSLYPQLAQQGIKPLSENSDLPSPLLQVRILNLEVSAFDFLFTRRIRARVELEASLISSTDEIIWRQTFSGHSATLRRYGFNQELRESLDEALLEAIEPLADLTQKTLARRS